MNQSPTVGRYLIALILIGFLFSGNAEANEVPCDNRPQPVCFA